MLRRTRPFHGEADTIGRLLRNSSKSLKSIEKKLSIPACRTVGTVEPEGVALACSQALIPRVGGAALFDLAHGAGARSHPPGHRRRSNRVSLPFLGAPSFRPQPASARPRTAAQTPAAGVSSMAASSVGEKEKERPGGGSGAAGGNSTRERLLSALEDLEVLSR